MQAGQATMRRRRGAVREGHAPLRGERWSLCGRNGSDRQARGGRSLGRCRRGLVGRQGQCRWRWGRRCGEEWAAPRARDERRRAEGLRGKVRAGEHRKGRGQGPEPGVAAVSPRASAAASRCGGAWEVRALLKNACIAVGKSEQSFANDGRAEAVQLDEGGKLRRVLGHHF